jgi:NAD(P)-dependent dehydrogenase (short-subunit alcohol dehydrogenase family)
VGKLDGKVALITGASRGIGTAIARAYSREGTLGLALASRTGSDLGLANAIGIKCDVRNRGQVEEAVATTVSRFGGLDICVNNAGLNHRAGLFETTEEDWDRLIDTDLKGTFLVSQAAARHMVETGRSGVIVNLSSVMGVLALAEQIPYCAAKGGVNQLTKALALSLADKGIRVNGIGPGPVETELMRKVVPNPEKERELLARMPLGRIATPEEIATVAVFLACDDSAFITGQTIYPDGGRMIQGFPRRMEA